MIDVDRVTSLFDDEFRSLGYIYERNAIYEIVEKEQARREVSLALREGVIEKEEAARLIIDILAMQLRRENADRYEEWIEKRLESVVIKCMQCID